MNSMAIELEEKSRPLVSIVTVVLNGEGEIRKTIESVIRQKYEKWEYIFIDGGSTDNTVEIIKEYEEYNISWISEKDNGISDAFNKGIGRACGSIIGILNAGDWYEDGAIERIVAAFLQNGNVDIVCGDVQYWQGKEKAYRCASRPDLLEKEMSVTHPSCFVKKKVYDRYGMFDTEYKLAMDYELLLRLKNAGGCFLVISEILANMQHGGVSEENWRSSLHETHSARKKVLTSSLYTSCLYLQFLICKRGLRKLLEKMKMDTVIRVYRRKNCQS